MAIITGARRGELLKNNINYMKYKIESFRHGELILENEPKYKVIWDELIGVIESITEEEIIERHESFESRPKSISKAINNILKDKLVNLDWNDESYIFQEAPYIDKRTKRWRLDFAKDSISVEVAFNHGEAIAWNLLKPVLAGELNHVKKEIDTEVGVIICATKDLKDKGGFDGAVGEYEKFLTYLNPLRDVLTVPMVLIGLEAPESFEITVKKVGGSKQGFVTKL
jgi:hypothetical protein